jgi:Phage terminase large subunit (GpA)
MSALQPFEIVGTELAAYFSIEAELEALDTPVAVCDLPPLAWAEACRRIEDQPFSLDYDPAPGGDHDHPKGYEPLREIYDDDHPFIVIMKPAQVGVSELAITRALHALELGARFWRTTNDGLNVGYLFPTETALFDFSKERISPLRDESDHLSKFFDNYDDVGFKQAGKSYLYIRGAWSVKALKSFKADLLILDELDEMLPRAVALAVKRLRHSQVKRQLWLSTPTKPDIGIHAAYLDSDQCEWEVHCSSCGAWNTLNFFRDVKVAGADYDDWKFWSDERIYRSAISVACPACRQSLKDADRYGPGRWVQRRPEITRVRGYHVPALSFPSVSLTDLCVAAISPDPEKIIEFYRSDLGLPYEPAGSRITEEMLKQLSTDLEAGRLPANVRFARVTMGVDVGARYHYRISGDDAERRRCVIAMGSVRTWAELDTLMERYHVRHCVVDAMPELHGAEDWAKKHAGKVLRAFYQDLKGDLFRRPAVEAKEAAGKKVDRPKELKKDTVLIDRTMAMDTIYNVIALGRELWPAEIHNDAEVRAHMTAPLRKVKENEEGQPYATWEHTKPDHLYHACVYDLVALKTLPKPLPGILAQGTVKVRLANE